MKLFVCLFLILMVIEEYNCAPYRTRNRHRHHHHFQIGRSRQRSPYRSPSGPYTRHHHGYQPMYDMYHPWRNTRHCTWHASRYSSRHCSGHGYRHGSRFYNGYGSQYSFQYGKNNFIPNTTPIDKPEDQHVIVEKPMDNEVGKTSEGSMYMSTEKQIANEVGKTSEGYVYMSTVKPKDNEVGKTSEGSVYMSTEKPITTEDTSEKPIEVPVEIVTDKSTETSNVWLAPTDKTTGTLVEKPMEKSTLAITVTTAKPETMIEDKPQNLIIEMPLDKLASFLPEENARVNHDRSILYRQWMDSIFYEQVPKEKSLEKPTEEPAEKLVEKVAEKQTQILDVEPTEKATEMPVDISIEKSTPAITVAAAELVTMPQDKPQDLTVEEFLDKLVENPTENVSNTLLTNSDNNLSEYSTVNLFGDWPTENLSDLSTESPF